MYKNLNTLEKKLYQLIISRLDGDRIGIREYREGIFRLVRKGIGGLILFKGELEEVRDFIRQIQAMAEIPLFIASDIERGVGQQLRNATPSPCNMAVSAAIDHACPEHVLLFREAIRAFSSEATDAGINMPLVPVLDVNQNPDNPIVCTRAFSDQSDDVAWYGTEYIRILESTGLISCAKHFPGHGDTDTDSHLSLPVIRKTHDELMKVDIHPFRGAITAGARGMMIGHIQIPAIDSAPASLSSRVITDLLRKDLGFDGLILTDALNMAALSGIENIPARCLKAGVDVLLHPEDPEMTVREIESAVESKMIREDVIDLSIGRILKAKSGLRLLKTGTADYRHNRMLSGRISDMSITSVKYKEGILPLRDLSKVKVVFAGDDKFVERSLWKDFSAIHDEKITLFAIFSETAAWKGRSGIDIVEKNRLVSLIKNARVSIVVSFGSPYVLRHFRDADMLIAAYEGSAQAQESVMRCLKGEMELRGRLPVKL